MSDKNKRKKKSSSLENIAAGAGKYWICEICVVLMNLTTKYPAGGNTISRCKCDWCGDETWTTPIVDFKESGNLTWD